MVEVEKGLIVASPERIAEIETQKAIPLRIDTLEQENADLWYDTMVKDTKIEQSEAEIALLWYELMQLGGNANVV